MPTIQQAAGAIGPGPKVLNPGWAAPGRPDSYRLVAADGELRSW
jgi:hypothetical protein